MLNLWDKLSVVIKAVTAPIKENEDLTVYLSWGTVPLNLTSLLKIFMQVHKQTVWSSTPLQVCKTFLNPLRASQEIFYFKSSSEKAQNLIKINTSLGDRPSHIIFRPLHEMLMFYLLAKFLKYRTAFSVLPSKDLSTQFHSCGNEYVHMNIHNLKVQ